jgi:hypothetical protein
VAATVGFFAGGAGLRPQSRDGGQQHEKNKSARNALHIVEIPAGLRAEHIYIGREENSPG